MSAGAAPDQSLDGAGAELRATRQRKSMAPGEVAEQLHLEEAVIVAIEEGRFDALPPHAYVRGYVRAYARLVGLDADDMTTRFDAASGDRTEPSVVLPRPSRPAFRDVAQRRMGLLFSSVVAAAFLAVAIALWMGWRYFDWSFTPANGDAGAELPALPEDVAEEVAEEVESPAAPVPASGEPGATADTSDGEPDSVADDPAGAVEEASTTPNAAVQTGERESSPAGGEADAQARAAAFVDELMFRFKEDSWVEVRNADGEPVYMDIGRAGQSRSVAGKAPFSILVGYAPGVEVAYNGDPLALEPHTRASVARLVVGH